MRGMGVGLGRRRRDVCAADARRRVVFVVRRKVRARRSRVRGEVNGVNDAARGRGGEV